MKLRPEQLHQHLRNGLSPVYLVTGDEPLQLLEAADDIRRSAREHGYSERQVMEAGTGFDWNSLGQEADALSLFAELRVLDLRIPSGKPGREGGQAICDYLERPADDTLLLVTMPKLDASQQRSKWFRAIENKGAVIQVWPVPAAQMPGWIKNRAQHHGLQLSFDAAQLLAQHTEGNLLAAAQELDKLRLNHGVGNLGVDQVMESVSGHAHFTVFELVDAALAGDATRGIRILRSLQAEGTPEAQAELREVIQTIVDDDMKANIEGLQAIHLKSDKFTKFGPREFDRQDVASADESEAAFFSSVEDLTMEVKDLKIDVFGDVAVATYYPHVTFVRDGEKTSTSGRQTLVFLKTPGGWKIVHEHGTPKR